MSDPSFPEAFPIPDSIPFEQIIQDEILHTRLELFKEENKGKRIQDSIQQDLQIKM
jgi:hypothetical protein